MKDETDPITDDEWFPRRVRVEKFRTDMVPVISPNAFEPRVKGRDPDTDGISLYRAECLAQAEEVLTTVSMDRWHEFGIVRIPASLLKSLNLTVRSVPDNRVKGHVVIPELNAGDYEADKARFTLIKERLAAAASEDDNILRSPTPPPTT
jgi:hypothetical protein